MYFDGDQDLEGKNVGTHDSPQPDRLWSGLYIVVHLYVLRVRRGLGRAQSGSGSASRKVEHTQTVVNQAGGFACLRTGFGRSTPENTEGAGTWLTDGRSRRRESGSGSRPARSVFCDCARIKNGRAKVQCVVPLRSDRRSRRDRGHDARLADHHSRLRSVDRRDRIRKRSGSLPRDVAFRAPQGNLSGDDDRTPRENKKSSRQQRRPDREGVLRRSDRQSRTNSVNFRRAHCTCVRAPPQTPVVNSSTTIASSNLLAGAVIGAV